MTAVLVRCEASLSAAYCNFPNVLGSSCVQVGVNINGDVCKLAADFGARVAAAVELSEEANRRVLTSIPNVTRDVEFKSRWSLADLTKQVGPGRWPGFANL